MAPRLDPRKCCSSGLSLTVTLPYVPEGNAMSLNQLGASFLCERLFISGCHSSNPASNTTVRNVKIAQWGQALYLIVNISIWETSVPGKVATHVDSRDRKSVV